MTIPSQPVIIGPRHADAHRHPFGSTRSDTSEQSQPESGPIPRARLGLPVSRKPYFLSWRFLGGVFATLLVVGWVFIIVVLIQEEKWQLVLVAWLLLYAAAHFCYWYFKKHHLLSMSLQTAFTTGSRIDSIQIGNGDPEKSSDSPPSYEEIHKVETPPPEYYSVTINKNSFLSSQKHPILESPFFHKILGRTVSTESTISVPSISNDLSISSSKQLPPRFPTPMDPNTLKIKQILKSPQKRDSKKEGARSVPQRRDLNPYKLSLCVTRSAPTPPSDSTVGDIKSHLKVTHSSSMGVSSVAPSVPIHNPTISAVSVSRSSVQADSSVTN